MQLFEFCTLCLRTILSQRQCCLSISLSHRETCTHTLNLLINLFLGAPRKSTWGPVLFSYKILGESLQFGSYTLLLCIDDFYIYNVSSNFPPSLRVVCTAKHSKSLVENLIQTSRFTFLKPSLHELVPVLFLRSKHGITITQTKSLGGIFCLSLALKICIQSWESSICYECFCDLFLTLSKLWS